MSYILDALRKADAQRERDPARGIHAQVVPHAGSAPRDRPAVKPLWIGGGLVLFALLSGAAWFVSREAPVQHAPAVAANPPASAPAATAGVSAVAHATPEAVLVPAPTEPKIATSTDLRPARGPIRTQQAQADPAMAAPHSARGAAAAAAATGVLPAPASPPLEAAAGLPSDAPKIAITGGVYSASAVQRMLIVNGQVFNEGSEIAPGVIVEQIKARTAVLKFKGTRYTVAY